MTGRTLSIGISPCPNDTFIFFGLLNRKIDTGELAFKPVFEDVETLNHMALKKELDVAKVSFHALGYILDEYTLLRSGSALGKGCGPLIVAREKLGVNDLAGKRIAVPGRYTTAFLLLKLCAPVLAETAVFMPFERIMESVRRDEVDAGVIIHEGRFTYPLYGLVEIMDLGEWWEEKTSCPIPLGAIVARRTLGKIVVRIIENSIRDSIQYAREHGEEATPFIIKHAQEMERDVISSHIDLYVNDYSSDLGEEGIRSIETLFRIAREKGVFPQSRIALFEGNEGS